MLAKIGGDRLTQIEELTLLVPSTASHMPVEDRGSGTGKLGGRAFPNARVPSCGSGRSLFLPAIIQSLPPCSKLSRRGLEKAGVCRDVPERRPALTASARAGLGNLLVGAEESCGAVEQKKGLKQESKSGARTKGLTKKARSWGDAQPLDPCGYNVAF